MTDPTPEDKAVALAEKYFLKSAKDYKDGAYYCDNADVIAMLADHEQQVREAIATMQTQNEEHLKDKVAMAMANEQLQARVGQLERALKRLVNKGSACAWKDWESALVALHGPTVKQSEDLSFARAIVATTFIQK